MLKKDCTSNQTQGTNNDMLLAINDSAIPFIQQIAYVLSAFDAKDDMIHE